MQRDTKIIGALIIASMALVYSGVQYGTSGKQNGKKSSRFSSKKQT